jgi:hypothetical protein
VSQFSDAIRAAVVARAGGRCEYCHLPTRGQVATFPIDHIIPSSDSGADDLDNLALACPNCNGHKWSHVGGIDPGSGRQVRLFNPRTDDWQQHFRWSALNRGILDGLTATGRTTIERLRINDPKLVSTRILLATLGVAPDAAG